MKTKLVVFITLFFVWKLPSVYSDEIYTRYKTSSYRNLLLQNRTHLELINYLIQKNNYKTYLEIGTANCQNIKRVIAPIKIGIDPGYNWNCPPSLINLMTSDEFFAQNSQTFDIIFIDGLHHSEQVLKDVENSLKFLNPGGLIVMHDCLPNYEHEQVRPFKGGNWTGDVWKAAAYLRMKNENIHLSVLDMDFGCGIINPQSGQILHEFIPQENLTWEIFINSRETLLNVISLEDWLELN